MSEGDRRSIRFVPSAFTAKIGNPPRRICTDWPPALLTIWKERAGMDAYAGPMDSTASAVPPESTDMSAVTLPLPTVSAPRSSVGPPTSSDAVGLAPPSAMPTWPALGTRLRLLLSSSSRPACQGGWKEREGGGSAISHQSPVVSHQSQVVSQVINRQSSAKSPVSHQSVRHQSSR